MIQSYRNSNLSKGTSDSTADKTPELESEHVMDPMVNPFRPDLPFNKDQPNKEETPNRTTEW